jgi:glycopeptide antibiotics resistance protein
MKHRRDWFWWVIVGAIAAWLLWMTLRPNTTVATDLSPLTQRDAAGGISSRVLIELAGNVVVFVPLGAALVLALGDRSMTSRLLTATLTGAVLSLGIELAQTALPSRVTSARDLLLNTAGTSIGALFGCWIQGRVYPAPNS